MRRPSLHSAMGGKSRVQTVLGLQERFKEFWCENAEQMDVSAEVVSFSFFFSLAFDQIISVWELIKLTGQLVAGGNGCSQYCCHEVNGGHIIGVLPYSD